MTKQLIDPVQGLVNYVLDAKPYHTKIAEVQVGYVYTENVDVTITDRLTWQIDMFGDDTLPVSYDCGYGVNPYGGSDVPSTIYLVALANADTNQFILDDALGDQTANFPAGTPIRALSSTSQDLGDFTVYTSYFDGTNTVIQVMQKILGEVASSIAYLGFRAVGYGEPDYCALTSSPRMYVGAYVNETLQFKTDAGQAGVEMAKTDRITVSQANAAISETIQFDMEFVSATWTYTIIAIDLGNSIIEVSGNALQDIQLGTPLTISGSTGNDGTYRVSPMSTSNGLILYGPEYLSGSNTTRFRVFPTLPSAVADGSVGPNIAP